MPSTTDFVRVTLNRRRFTHGLALRKSLLRGETHVDDWGGFMLVDRHRNMIVCGSRLELDLDAVEAYLMDD